MHSTRNKSNNKKAEKKMAAQPGILAAAAPPLLALLQAAPLVFNNGESLQPIDLLDLKKERDAVLAALRRAGRRVQVACDYCTTTTLRSLLTDGMRLLHYSGDKCPSDHPAQPWRCALCGHVNRGFLPADAPERAHAAVEYAPPSDQPPFSAVAARAPPASLILVVDDAAPPSTLRAAMAAVLPRLPADAAVGLLTYGAASAAVYELASASTDLASADAYADGFNTPQDFPTSTAPGCRARGSRSRTARAGRTRSRWTS